MIFGIIISTIAFISYVYFGFFVFLKKPRSAMHRTFLYFCLLFALWNLSMAVLFSEPSSLLVKNVWERLRYTGADLYSIFIFMFFMKYTGYEKKLKYKYLIYILLWIIPVILLYQNIMHNSIAKSVPYGFWLVLLNLYSGIFLNTISIFIGLIWALKSKLKRNIIQTRIMTFSGIVTVILALLSDFTLPLIGWLSISSSCTVIWISSVFYVMIKYQFMNLTGEKISINLINCMNESVILVSIDRSIAFLNNNIINLIGKDRSTDYDITDLIQEHEKINTEIDQILYKSINDFSCRFHLISRQGPILMDAKFLLINDLFNEPLGIMIKANVVKEKMRLKVMYKLTDRELEIVNHIINGKTNRLIAFNLGIKENTLKRHITNIYNKLSIGNKVDLFNLLKEYNIMPGIKADKTLILMPRNIT